MIFPSPYSSFSSTDINNQISEYFSYHFIESSLKNSKDLSPYKFSDDYDSLGKFVLLYIQCLLKELSLQEVWLTNNNPTVNIFHSLDFFSNRNKLLVIIQGRGEVRAGQWSRKACINDNLEFGSILPYVKTGMAFGYSIIVLNPNFNVDYNGCIIPFSSSMIAHCEFVWENFISNSPASKVFIAAHSCGGVCTLALLKKHNKEFFARVKGIALLDSVHKTVAELNNDEKKLFSKIAKNWKKSNKPLGTKVPSDRNEGCECVSAGDPRHEYTSGAAFSEIFPFFESKVTRK